MSDMMYMIVGSLGFFVAVGLGIYTVVAKHKNKK